MSEVPKNARERLAPYLKKLDAEPDTHWLSMPRWVLSLALSALDAQEAAGKGVTEEMVERAAEAISDADCDGGLPWYLVRSDEQATYREFARAALLAVHPAIFAAGERAGLEKAAAWHVHAAYLAEREAECTHDLVRRAELELHAARERKAATAIRALTGGTP